MIVFDNEQVVGFDVDDTLVMWFSDCSTEEKIFVTCPYSGEVTPLKPHKRHIDLLKKYKGRGMTVMVWSAAGYKWAELIVKELGLESYVDCIMTKPCKLVDDLPPEEIFTTRVYLDEK